MSHPARISNFLVAGCVVTLLSSGCITIAPNSPPLSWKSLKRPKVQTAAYEEKVEEAPHDPKHPAKLRLAYGRLMEESGQLAEARKNYAAVAELQPKNVEAVLGLARLDQLAGDIEQAEIGYKKAAKVDPNSALAQYSLGQFYATQNRWQEAADALTKAMLAQPDETQPRYALAVALVHTGNIDAALPHFIRTVGDAEAHYNVGLILQEEGRLEDAERHFSLAVAKKPDLEAAQSWLAHVRQQRQTQLNGKSSSETGLETSAVVPVGHSALQPQTGPTAPLPASGKVSQQLSRQQIEQRNNQLSLSTLPAQATNSL